MKKKPCPLKPCIVPMCDCKPLCCSTKPHKHSCWNWNFCVTKQLHFLIRAQTCWVIKAPTLSKTKSHLCSWRRSKLWWPLHNQRVSLPSFTFTLFTVCTHQCLKGGSIQASTQLNFNVTDSIIGTHFILHFTALFQPLFYPTKQERERGSLFSHRLPACWSW